MKKIEEIQNYLDTVSVRTELSSFEKAKVLDLTNQGGLHLLLGLLLAERQGQLMRVLNLRCAGEEEARQLGVLQGFVHGIDRLHQILLECATVDEGAVS